MERVAMDQVTVRVDASGRVVIPRDLRDALGIPDGGELRLSVRDGELRATTRLAALRRIRAELRGLAPTEPAAEALIAGRRAEAARGLHEDQAPAPTATSAKPPGRG
jgi:AbrB family looped-hinge helix DNA binding protein